jgi:hypothetical protein
VSAAGVSFTYYLFTIYSLTLPQQLTRVHYFQKNLAKENLGVMRNEDLMQESEAFVLPTQGRQHFRKSMSSITKLAN